jgi:hypothetical protein
MAWHGMSFQTVSKKILTINMRQKKHNLPLYPSGLFVEHAQKSILVFISEITSGAQSVLLWKEIKTT